MCPPYQPTAKFLLEELAKHPGVISFDPATYEVNIRGKRMRGSNITDLLGHVLRSRKSVRAPAHADSFLKLLADLNLPEELVRNKYQISRFRKYKQGDPSGGARVRIPTSDSDGFEDVEDSGEDERDGLLQRPMIRAQRRLKRSYTGGDKPFKKYKNIPWKPI